MQLEGSLLLAASLVVFAFALYMDQRPPDPNKIRP